MALFDLKKLEKVCMWSVVVFSILINVGTYKSYDALNQKNVRFVFNDFRNHIKIIV